MFQSWLSTFLLLFISTTVLAELRFSTFLSWFLAFTASFRTAFYCLAGIGLLFLGVMQLRETWKHDR